MNEYPLWMRLCMAVGPLWSFVIITAGFFAAAIGAQHIASAIHF